MWTLALWSRKGGAGKSTLVACLGAYAAAAKGERIAIVDADPQGSIASWKRAREVATPDVVAVPLLRLKDALATAEADGYSGVVVDLPGSFGPGELGALELMDFVAVPARPSPFDFGATVTSIDVVQAAKVNLGVVLTQVRPRGRGAAEAADVRAALSERALVFAPEIHELVAYPNAIADGLGVTESEPNGAAAEEIRNLYAALRRTLKRG